MFASNPAQGGYLRFSLFGFPVAIHWFFWILALLIGPIGIANSPTGLRILLIWILVVLVSILVHELGHAFAYRKYGGRPQIVLHGMGGLAMAHGHFNRKQSIIITLGGPFFGLLLGSVFWILAGWSALPQNLYIGWLFVSMIQVNIFWSLLNLLPILPLDGGQLLGHLMHGRRPVLRGQIGAGCAVLVGVALFALSKSLFPLLLFGFLAYQNYQAAQGARRGF
jgi:stage IV sporulation protein FB